VLTIIHQQVPALLTTHRNAAGGSRRPLLLTATEADRLMATIKGSLDWNSHGVRCRVIQVLEVGNKLGLFSADLPKIPLPPLELTPSPFHYPTFDAYLHRLPRLKRSFVASLGLIEPIDSVAHWGQIFLSAMLFGGLMVTARITAIPAAMRAKEHNDPIRWLDLPRGKNERGHQQHPTHRWIVDPLTRLLLVRSIERNHDDSALGRGQKSHRLKRAINRYLSLIPEGSHQIYDLRAFQKQLSVHLHTRIPAYLVKYVRQQNSSYTVPDLVWQRLMQVTGYPDMSLSLAQAHKGHGVSVLKLSVGEGDEKVGDEEGEPFLHLDYVQLINCIVENRDNFRTAVEVWSVQHGGGTLLPSVKLLADWILDWLTLPNRHQKRALGMEEVYRLLRTTGRRLVGSIGDSDPATFTAAEQIALFQLIQEDCDRREERRRVTAGLLSWYDFLVFHCQIEQIDEEDLEEFLGEAGAVDANLVKFSEFTQAQQWLYTEAIQKYRDHEVAEALCLIMAAGFYLGLRRSEVIGIRVGDLIGEEDLFLYLSNNHFRRLKTINAERVLPVSVLMPAQPLQRFRDWLNRQRRAEAEVAVDEEEDIFDIDHEAQKKNVDHFLFPYFQSKGPSQTRFTGFNLIREALQRASRDPTVRFHHLRHAFANWTLLRFAGYELERSGVPFPVWLLPDPLDRKALLQEAISVREPILGKAPTNRRMLLQITQLLGHASSSITVGSYIHIMDLLLGLYMRRFTPEFNAQQLMFLVEGRSYIKGKFLREDGEDQGRLRMAELLDQESDRIIALSGGGQSIQRQPILTLKLLSRPLPHERLRTIASALFLLDEQNSLEEVSTQIGVKRKRIELWDERSKKILNRNIFVQYLLKNRYHPKNLTIHWMPKGERQRTVAQEVAEHLFRLRKEGDFPHLKPQATSKKIHKALGLMVNDWVSGTALTVVFTKVEDAKSWIWLLGKIGLSDDLVVEHVALIKGNYLSPTSQRTYWSDKLKVEVVNKTRNARLITQKKHSNGELYIRVRSSSIHIGSQDRSSKVIEGIRLALVAEWIDF